MFYEIGTHRQHGLSPRSLQGFRFAEAHRLDLDGERARRQQPRAHSFFNGVAGDPPCVMFASGAHPHHGGKKDSQINAETTGEFVCSIVGHAQREAMNRTSIHLPYGEDEMPDAGLEGLPSTLVKPPCGSKARRFTWNASICRACRCRHLRRGTENWVIFGQVVGVHVDRRSSATAWST